MELFEHAEEDVLLFRSRVDEATRLAAQTMRDSDALKTRKGRRVRTAHFLPYSVVADGGYNLGLVIGWSPSGR